MIGGRRSDDRIIDLESMAKLASRLRGNGQTIALCHGTFDLLHSGHIKHLQVAREFADCLFVTVTADAFVNKGPGRPVFNEALRAENLAALSCVDYVAVSHSATSVELLTEIKPNFYVKGSEYEQPESDLTGNISSEQSAVEAHGGKMCFTHEPTFSSSQLLNEHFAVFPETTRDFLNAFKTKHPAEQLINALKSLRNTRVLVVGDAIIDEYHYTETLGLSGKGNVFSVRYKEAERFAGGAFAVANHLAGFVNEVTVCSGIGRSREDRQFIQNNLKANVTAQLFDFPQASTLIKRRYLDMEMSKLFEVYFGEEHPLSTVLEQQISQWLAAEMSNYDLVVVPDFGNGLITPALVSTLTGGANYLAVNTQINSGNRGYHAITRYPKADFISLNEPELRLASHDKQTDLATLGRTIGTQLDASYLAVTRGIHGAMGINPKDQSVIEIPALASKVVDRIGAGDAFLSLTSLCLANGITAEMATFIGSAAAAMNVQTVCNSNSVESTALFKYITTLLK